MLKSAKHEPYNTFQKLVRNGFNKSESLIKMSKKINLFKSKFQIIRGLMKVHIYGNPISSIINLRNTSAYTLKTFYSQQINRIIDLIAFKIKKFCSVN